MISFLNALRNRLSVMRRKVIDLPIDLPEPIFKIGDKVYGKDGSIGYIIGISLTEEYYRHYGSFYDYVVSDSLSTTNLHLTSWDIRQPEDNWFLSKEEAAKANNLEVEKDIKKLQKRIR